MSSPWKESDVGLVAPRVAHRVIDGQAIIVHPTENRIITLNATGSAIWARFDGRSVGEIVSEIVTTFEVERETLLADALRFIGGLEDRQLVVRASSVPGGGG